MSAVHDIERQLLWRPMSANEIARRLGMWSPRTVKRLLEILVGKGRAIRDCQPTPSGGFRCRYRRSIGQATESL